MASMPMDQGAPSAEGASPAQGSATDLLVQTGGALTKLSALFAKAPGLSDEQKQGMAQLESMYKSLVSSLTPDGGGEKGAAVPMKGPSTMEAGVSGKAVPAM